MGFSATPPAPAAGVLNIIDGTGTRALRGNDTGNNTATGDDATAFGSSSQATDNTCFAAGSSAKATGFNSIALGNTADASGLNSIALNAGIADSEDAMAMGNGANAAAQDAVAIGNSTNAFGAQSLAMGEETQADFKRSTAMGYRSKARQEGSFATAGFGSGAGSGTFQYVRNMLQQTAGTGSRELFIGNPTGAVQMSLPNTSAFHVRISAMAYDGGTDSANWSITAFIRTTGAGVTSLVGKTGDGIPQFSEVNGADWTLALSVTNGKLILTGDSTTETGVQWIAVVETGENTQ